MVFIPVDVTPVDQKTDHVLQKAYFIELMFIDDDAELGTEPVNIEKLSY